MAEQAKSAGAIKILYQDGSSFEHTSPFEIAASLRHLIGEVVSARPTVTGALLIKLKNPEQAAILLQQDQFLSKPATFSTGEELKFVEAYSSAPQRFHIGGVETSTSSEPAGSARRKG